MITKEMVISRSEFIERYQKQFDKLFIIQSNGICVIKPMGGDILELHDITLPGWSGNTEIFQQFIDFISSVVKPTDFVFAEVESIDKFTEVIVVPAERSQIDSLWSHSRLPHFNTVCFDESASWCALFDNFEDKLYIYRATF